MIRINQLIIILFLNPRYIALYNYTPQKKDELHLKKNELYVVHEKCLDGWYKGSSVKTNQMGVFPGNYLLPARYAITTKFKINLLTF